MKKKISKLLLIVSLLVLGLSSCSEDVNYEGITNKQEEVNLTINTRSGNELTNEGTTDENAIQSLRAIVFEVTQSGTTLVYKQQLYNQYFNGNPSNITVKFSKCDNVRILLIANEKTDAAWNLDDMSKRAEDIKNISVVYGKMENQAIIDTPIIMFAESETKSGQYNQSFNLSLIRNLARVDLSLNCTYSSLTGAQAGGKLKLLAARIERMAPMTGLGNSINNLDISENFLTGVETLFKEGVNYQSTDEGFSLGYGEKDYVTFYVPEYLITNTQVYTYIYITGQYTPSSTSTPITVAYNFPIGGNITNDKLNGTDSFIPADLEILRNNLYEMKGTIKTLQQINEINVNVKKWDIEDVNGSINKPQPSKLNISNLTPELDIQGGTTLVQFWSDQLPADIRVLPKGVIKESGETFNVNTIFSNLAKENSSDLPKNVTFEGRMNDGQWGRLALTFKTEVAVAGKTYVITLAAGSLQRTIEVAAVKTTGDNEDQTNKQN